MEQLYVTNSLEKGRKSIARVDTCSKKKKEKNKLDLLVDELGVGNFKHDLVVNRRVKKSDIIINLVKAGTAHLPKGSERYAYKPVSEYGIIYIPVNRLKQIYQTDKATNPRKVKENMRKMKEGIPLNPIQIGYNYDVQDGHHRWEAAIKAGYSHVPCEVVGTDKKKVKEAKKKYREVWKGFQTNVEERLAKSMEEAIQKFIEASKEEEISAIETYTTILNKVTDPKIRPILEEIANDERDHYHNLNQVLKYVKGDEKALEKEHLSKSLALVIDLTKGGQLHRGKLVKKRIPYKGKNGKVHYRMAWIDPNKDKKGIATGKGEATYMHHEEGIKDLEKRQSNKFPVRHIELGELRNTIHNYRPDKQAMDDAIKKYHNGDKLPPVKISPTGEILDHHELVDMAKDLGLSHIPVIIMGNPALKKQLENKLKDQVLVEEDANEEGRKELIPIQQSGGDTAADRISGLSSDIVQSVREWRKYTSKIYTHQYLMEQAKKQDIVWMEYTKNGDPLGANSHILWKNAYLAIEQHIASGEPFVLPQNEKDINKRMEQENKDNMHKYFMKLMNKFGNDRQAAMEWCKKHNLPWKENTDPSKNWMNFVAMIKKELSLGHMVNGIRTRQKEAIEESNVQITDQIKDQVKGYGKKYGKYNVMERAEDLGIVFNRFDTKGNPLEANSAILWMRASQSIQSYIAKGNEFSMGGETTDNGLKTTVGDYGNVGLSKMQTYALDWAKRNSQNFEPTAKKYAIDCFKIDRGISDVEAEELYKQLMEKSRNARTLVHIDPLEKLPNGVNLIDQLTADGEFKNDYYLNRGLEREHREANEAYLFGTDYNEASDKDRPNYGVVDFYNRGLKSSPYGGGMAFVLKNDSDTVKRSTGTALDGDSIPYGEEGKWVKSMEDPHQLLIDRWYSKWKKPRKADGQRRRAIDGILDGTPNEDVNYYEAQLHGGLNFQRDVDHMLVPKEWQTMPEHKEKYQRVQEFGKLLGIPIKYE